MDFRPRAAGRSQKVHNVPGCQRSAHQIQRIMRTEDYLERLYVLTHAQGSLTGHRSKLSSKRPPATFTRVWIRWYFNKSLRGQRHQKPHIYISYSHTHSRAPFEQLFRLWQPEGFGTNTNRDG
jgi:hypothetical protein